MARSSPRSVELPHLATFVKAAEHGSFTAAAAELGINQAYEYARRILDLHEETR